MDESPGSHLSVVIDLSPTQWHLSAQTTNVYPLAFNTFLSQLLAFLNAHIAAKHENSLAVFGALPGKSVMLYSSVDQQVDASLQMDSNSYLAFKSVDSAIVGKIMEHLDDISDQLEEAPCALVGALTKALCYINRTVIIPSAGPIVSSTQTETPLRPLDPRILVLSVSQDLTTSYIPVMNSIFSAQKLKVTMDVCQMYGSDSVFLQQAAHLTGGSYIFLERRDALLQYLIMAFLSPPAIRKILSVPTQDRIDFRAACFCHKNIVDIGFVCSVCLSIFCQPVPVCSTCRTKFPIKTLQRLNASKPLLVQTNSVNTNGSAPRAQTPANNQLPNSNSISTNSTSNGHR